MSSQHFSPARLLRPHGHHRLDGPAPSARECAGVEAKIKPVFKKAESAEEQKQDKQEGGRKKKKKKVAAIPRSAKQGSHMRMHM